MGVTNCAERRQAFVERMGQGVAIIAAAPQATRSNDVEYRYRQDNDLLYLTGFPEPNCLCVLSPQHDRERFILFVQPRDREKETWTGKRYGTDGAREVFGADAAYTIDQVREILPKHLAQTDNVYFAPGRDEGMNALIRGLIDDSRSGRARTGRGVVSLVDPGAILHEMRLFKSAGELELMRKAVAASASAHVAAMSEVRDGPSSTSWRRCWSTISARPAGPVGPIRPSSPPAPMRPSSTTSRMTAACATATSCSSTPARNSTATART